jgi:hypothetical protein
MPFIHVSRMVLRRSRAHTLDIPSPFISIDTANSERTVYGLPSSVIRSLSFQRVHIILLQWLEGVCAGTIGTRTKYPAQDCIIVAVPRFVVYVRDLDIKINWRVAFDIHRRKPGSGTCPTTSILPSAPIYTAIWMMLKCAPTRTVLI